MEEEEDLLSGSGDTSECRSEEIPEEVEPVEPVEPVELELKTK